MQIENMLHTWSLLTNEEKMNDSCVREPLQLIEMISPDQSALNSPENIYFNCYKIEWFVNVI